jgi:hypothetical protein
LSAVLATEQRTKQPAELSTFLAAFSPAVQSTKWTPIVAAFLRAVIKSFGTAHDETERSAELIAHMATGLQAHITAQFSTFRPAFLAAKLPAY